MILLIYIHHFIIINLSTNQPELFLHKNSIKTATLIDNIYTNSTNSGNQYKWNLTFRPHHRNWPRSHFHYNSQYWYTKPSHLSNTKRFQYKKNVTKLKKSYTKKNWTDLYMIKSIHQDIYILYRLYYADFLWLLTWKKNNKK